MDSGNAGILVEVTEVNDVVDPGAAGVIELVLDTLVVDSDAVSVTVVTLVVEEVSPPPGARRAVISVYIGRQQNLENPLSVEPTSVVVAVSVRAGGFIAKPKVVDAGSTVTA